MNETGCPLPLVPMKNRPWTRVVFAGPAWKQTDCGLLVALRSSHSLYGELV